MSPQEASAVGPILFIGILVLIIGAGAGSILVAIGKRKRHNELFLRSAIAARDLPFGVVTMTPFQPAPGRPHAVWLDLSIKGGEDIRFELFLAVRLGGTVLLEGTYPVTYDSDEGDFRGFPSGAGVVALDSVHSSVLGKVSAAAVLRAFRFDAPPMPLAGEIHARLAIPPGLLVERARLLLTVGDSPL